MKTNRRNFIKALGGITLMSNLPAFAQENSIVGMDVDSVPENAKNALKFNANGKFKIVQFTDTHYIYQDPRSDAALERIAEVLDAEKPDFAVITGDVIYGKPAKEGLKHILSLISDRKIPFAITWGNHDAEYGVSREDLLKVAQSLPYNLTYTVPGISGVSNFILPIKSADGTHDSRILYFFDSHDYSKVKGVGGYDYIKQDQIDWYRNSSSKYTEANGGKPIPSLAFFHIALPEYKLAACNEAAILFGVRKERVCSPQMNSGLFATMRMQGDVEGVFVGHDHDNDYAVMWNNILLAYGRYSGGNTVYNDLPNGARVIELTDGKKGFRTWIRLKDDKIESEIVFPDSYLKK